MPPSMKKTNLSPIKIRIRKNWIRWYFSVFFYSMGNIISGVWGSRISDRIRIGSNTDPLRCFEGQIFFPSTFSQLDTWQNTYVHFRPKSKKKKVYTSSMCICTCDPSISKRDIILVSLRRLITSMTANISYLIEMESSASK